jgi:imidazolonepropionase-like amidohydrolase
MRLHDHAGAGLQLLPDDVAENAALLQIIVLPTAIELFLEKKAVLVPTLSAPFNIMEKGEKSGIPSFIIEKTRKVKDAHVASIKKAHKAGITIASGADSGTPFNLHGENLKELELLRGLLLDGMGKMCRI